MAKANGPLVASERSSAPLLRSTSPAPVSPVTVPPMEYRGGGLVMQVTATLVTFDPFTVPAPPETLQVWPDGWLRTVTE